MADQGTAESRVSAVDSAQAQGFEWGAIQWLVNGRRLTDSQLTFGYVEIKAGLKNPRHYHPNCDEVLYLLEGELDHSLGGDVYHLTAGMAIHIPTGIAHDAVNRGAQTARMVVAYSSGDRQTVTLEKGME